jgi:hypothetical protein
MQGEMNFIGPMDARPRYHANDTSRDVLDLDPQRVPVANARDFAEAPSLDREGFVLLDHESAVRDFTDADEVADAYCNELREVLLRLTGADAVVMTPRGVLRYSERSQTCGELDNSRPARFVHVDVSDATAAEFSRRSSPRGDTPWRRTLHLNAWRVLTPPPQDVPLAVCDARSVHADMLVAADAVFDTPGKPDWSFEGWVVRHDARQRWVYFQDMRPEELLVFRTNDSEPDRMPVPHSAFTVEDIPADTPPRASIEMRGICYWYD